MAFLQISKPDGISAMLCEFAFAEFASGIEMAQAAKSVDDKELIKRLLRHSLDEYRHARIFKELSESIHVRTKRNARRHRFLPRFITALGHIDKNGFLIEKKRTLSRFLCFVYVNEKNGAEIFSKKAVHWLEQCPSLETIIPSIISDEEKHICYSLAYLNDQNDKNTPLWMTFNKVSCFIRHLYGKHRTVGQVIAAVVLYIVSLLIYPLRFALSAYPVNII